MIYTLPGTYVRGHRRTYSFRPTGPSCTANHIFCTPRHCIPNQNPAHNDTAPTPPHSTAPHALSCSTFQASTGKPAELRTTDSLLIHTHSQALNFTVFTMHSMPLHTTPEPAIPLHSKIPHALNAVNSVLLQCIC